MACRPWYVLLPEKERGEEGLLLHTSPGVWVGGIFEYREECSLGGF